MNHDDNYININLANQLLILESNIIENEDIFRKKQNEIKELQVTIDDYEYISQFNVATMFQEEIDIILKLPWFKKLGTFILNMEKTFVTFSYKKKMMTFQDTAMRSKSIIPSSKDFKDISKVILQENQKSISNMQKELEEVIMYNNEEISRLKDHSQKLLTQIKKSKDKKQCVQKLEQEYQDLEKNLLETNEENSRLKNLNQGLVEQIKKLKEDKCENLDIKDIVKSDNEEKSRLKNHNQNLLMQIKKLKNDKKSLENKLELLIEKEASKFSDEQIQVMENGTITDPIHVIAQEVAKSTEKKTYSDVGVQTMKVSSVYPTINKTTSINEEDTMPKVKEETLQA
jgi:chromosome segregation protein